MANRKPASRRSGKLTLRDLGEDEVVRLLTSGLLQSSRTIAGPGDDAALVAQADGDDDGALILKTDCIVEKIHFEPDASPFWIGWKALCRCISDIAAMGGSPRDALITLGTTADQSFARIAAIYRGLRRAALKYGVSIVGGETVSLPPGSSLFLNVALTGTVKPSDAVLRSGGSPGDVLFVTGKLGGSLPSGRHLKIRPRAAEGRWLALRQCVHAMMDLSDGLAKDLPRLAKSSGCGFALENDAIPRQRGCSLENALSDGEDYELLLAVPKKSASALQHDWKIAFPRIKLTRIGQLVKLDGKKPLTLPSAGWDHFKD